MFDRSLLPWYQLWLSEVTVKLCCQVGTFWTNAFTVACRKIAEAQQQQQTSSGVFLVCALDFHEAGAYLNAHFAVDLKCVVS